LVLMPGLGGNPGHFHWLAGWLADAGWPVALLEHPGSDAEAVQALLDGRQPFDGSRALQQRLADLESVLTAQHDQRLPVPGEDVVLVGHSLGALTALLAAGAVPDAGTDRRCSRALVELPLTNLSRLLQCELAEGPALGTVASTTAPAAVVGLNSLGSLFWSQERSRRLSMPLLLVGGTLDLITPPLDEQVALFSALASHPNSRVVVVEGASHFSPIRVGSPSAAGAGDDLFQLGEDLVGVNPFTVQAIIGAELIDFLETLSVMGSGPDMDSKHLSHQDVRWHRLNRSLSTELVDRHQ
jgi:predicted dienelactone hydrolase